MMIDLDHFKSINDRHGHAIGDACLRAFAQCLQQAFDGPGALARDVSSLGEAGYALTGLRAFDLFPMTHHVECVAVLERS